MMPSGLTPMLLRPATRVRRSGSVENGDGCRRPSRSMMWCLRLDRGLAARERFRLDDCRRLGDLDGQRSVADGDLRDAHVRADDDRAGALVDDDACAGVSVSTARFSISAINRVRSAIFGLSTTTSWESAGSAIRPPKASVA